MSNVIVVTFYLRVKLLKKSIINNIKQINSYTYIIYLYSHKKDLVIQT